ncbi:unnamed protein product [Angiostrongylus costaricensis]|uniref:Methyltransf_11 domain-containing protein n=1 Tax=Angiostrongylus costaricensis TaxID=334426 RepID=A0A0R3PGK3_ANGCS|nr:unnamed protein product [Angiostrongylus costaricensis]
MPILRITVIRHVILSFFVPYDIVTAAEKCGNLTFSGVVRFQLTLSYIWSAEQAEWDSKLDIEKYVWTDKKFMCNVWNVETIEYYYRASLTKANRERNHRVRFGWNESLTSSVDYWNQRDASFDCFIGTEVLATNDDEAIKRITSIMKLEAKFVVLEPVESIDEPSIRKASHEEIIFRMDACGFKNISILDVTEDSKSAEVAFFSDHKLEIEPLDCKFLVIRASF